MDASLPARVVSALRATDEVVDLDGKLHVRPGAEIGSTHVDRLRAGTHTSGQYLGTPTSALRPAFMPCPRKRSHAACAPLSPSGAARGSEHRTLGPRTPRHAPAQRLPPRLPPPGPPPPLLGPSSRPLHAWASVALPRRPPPAEAAAAAAYAHEEALSRQSAATQE